MKTKKTWTEKVTAALKEAKIPDLAIDGVLLMGKNNVTTAVFADDKIPFMALPGIAEKRSQIIINALKKACMNARLSDKRAMRDKPLAFTLRTFSPEELFRDVLEQIRELANYRYNKDNPAELIEMRKKLDELIPELTKKESFTVRRKEGRITRLNRSILSDVFAINYDDPKPCKELVVAEHRIQRLLDFDWHLFAATQKEGEKKLDELCQEVYVRLGMYGLKVISNIPENGIDIYGGIASSPAHQKHEKVLMGEAKVMAAHQDFLWLGRPMRSFVEDIAMTGAEFWKFRANIIRPILRTYKDKEGNDLTIHDVLMVPDKKKLYRFAWARRFGGVAGRSYTEGADEEEVIVGDGAALGTENQQGGSAGMKWMMVDMESAVEAMAAKHGMTVQQVLDVVVEGIDGPHRFGDKKVICGDGCWKFDKAFDSYKDYLDWMDRMEKRYPGFSRLYVLRNSEEVEGEEKIRRLTRTLIQQWMVMSDAEKRKLTAKARAGLRKDKTLKGQMKRLAGLWKDKEDRTVTENLYAAAPWLILNPSIQEFLKAGWQRRQVEAASGKFRTEGQYPYIMQDPVALLEIWVLGMDPNDPNLGILKGDEVSVADVPDKKELCCVRFPANFLTAKVMTNKSCTKEFGSCGNIAIISVHSDILIRQDGDVDGDEMCILYNRLAIDMTKRMNEKYNPPVILFAHGSKAERNKFGGRTGYIREAYVALWRAKKFDSVGINANLATACAYLASDAEAAGNTALRDKYLVWMSAASTGAILAIDQVKGNAVDEKLISWLESIRKNVRKALQDIAMRLGVSKDDSYKVSYPFVHFYVSAAKRNPVPMENCVPMNDDNLCDSLAGLVLRDTGTWKFDGHGAIWNKEAAAEAIKDHSVRTTSIRNGIVTKEIIKRLSYNWFRRALNSEDKEVLKNFRVGNEVSMKDVLLLLMRNEMGMVYSMDGSDLFEKRIEYRKECKKIMYELADSREWVASAYDKNAPEGYVFTPEEKHASVANAFLTDALELGKRGNNVADRGSYACFVIGVFGEEALQNVLTNKIDVKRFFGIGCTVEELEIDTILDIQSDDVELFEAAPVYDEVVEEIPQPVDEYVPTDEELILQAQTFGIPDDLDNEFGFC